MGIPCEDMGSCDGWPPRRDVGTCLGEPGRERCMWDPRGLSATQLTPLSLPDERVASLPEKKGS
jgi:hypothetical protein